jgi:hypothetical protein
MSRRKGVFENILDSSGNSTAADSFRAGYEFVANQARQVIELTLPFVKDEVFEPYYAIGTGTIGGKPQGDNSPYDVAEVLQRLLNAANNKDSQAQFHVAFAYSQESQLQRDSQAYEFYTKAAKSGILEAQFNLGLCYLGGIGVSENPKTACKWFEKAAKKGLLRAQLIMGLMLLSGEGVSLHYSKAGKWFTKAAKQGSANAQFALGNIEYVNKKGKKNNKKAIKWYQMAVSQGHQGAQGMLNQMR